MQADVAAARKGGRGSSQGNHSASWSSGALLGSAHSQEAERVALPQLSGDRGREMRVLQRHWDSDTVLDLDPPTLTAARIPFIMTMRVRATGPFNEANWGT